MSVVSQKVAFAPIVNQRATQLILGSMPGEASLAAGQYYAFGRNAFWSIMAELFGVPLNSPYDEKLAGIQQQGIAVWDVLAACEREGSLDSAINTQTMIANDFQAFLTQYPSIKQIYFNGKTAEKLFLKHVLKQQALSEDIEMVALPSTSPANARIKFEEKLDVWRRSLTQ